MLIILLMKLDDKGARIVIDTGEVEYVAVPSGYLNLKEREDLREKIKEANLHILQLEKENDE